jgi:hypothetical protein
MVSKHFTEMSRREPSRQFIMEAMAQSQSKWRHSTFSNGIKLEITLYKHVLYYLVISATPKGRPGRPVLECTNTQFVNNKTILGEDKLYSTS